jgi:putative ABC transport system permease protein
MDDLTNDLARGARRLIRERGFAVVALLCLGLGIGANTAVFSVFNAVLLRPLPFPEPNGIAQIWTVSASATKGSTEYFSRTRNFVEFRRARGFQSIEGLVDIDFDLGGDLGDPERIRGGRATVGLFGLLGTTPSAGRLFDAEDGAAGNGDVVVISEGLFERRYGADADALGRRIHIDGRPHTLIGVVPERSGYPVDGDVWIPLVIDDLSEQELNQGMLTVLGRLDANGDLAQAREGLHEAAEVLREMYPELNTDFGLDAARLVDKLVEDVQGRVLALGAAVVLLLAIACANVANLLLVRLHRDARSAALCCSLGASRRRLIRQFLTENAVLAAAGGGLGIVLAYLAVPPLVGLMPEGVAGFDQVRIDLPALAFGLFAATGTLLLFGLVPAFSGSTPDLSSLLQTGGRTGGTKGSRRLQSAFVIAQISMGIVLLIGSGLLMKSLSRLGSVDPGFRSGGALTFRINAAPARYPDHESRVAFFRQLLEEIRTVPTVTGAGAAHVLPIGDIPWGVSFSVEGRPPEEPNQTEVAFYRLVTSGYLGAMGIPTLEGRDFVDGDAMGNPRVAIVSQEVVDRYWPGESGIGRRIKRGGYYSDNPWITVVGIVGDIHDNGLSETIGGAVYLPRRQYDFAYASVMSVVVRGSEDPATLVGPIEDRVRALDPNAPVFRVRTLDDIVTASLGAERFTVVLLLVFSGLGLTLAGAGVYGVMAHVVGERRREIAIRLAFGAQGKSVAHLVVRRAAALAGGGVLLGLVGATGLTHLASDLLYEVEALDLPVYLAVSGAMGLVALIACLVPATTAARIDPGVALRAE